MRSESVVIIPLMIAKESRKKESTATAEGLSSQASTTKMLVLGDASQQGDGVLGCSVVSRRQEHNQPSSLNGTKPVHPTVSRAAKNLNVSSPHL